MRIAVVGAYGNGKTTLTSALAPLLNVPRVHGNPMRDPAGAAAKSLEDCSELELLQLTVRRYSERVTAEERSSAGFLSDGSSLHEWIYLVVRLAVGRHPRDHERAAGTATSPYSEVVQHLGAVVKQRTYEAYDLFVHLPADIPLPAGETAVNERFRMLSDALLLQVLQELGCPVHVVRGTVPERVEQVVELVRARNVLAPAR
jgi:AAA domain-containing protein